MKEQSLLGISETFSINTLEGCKRQIIDNTNTKWYNIEISNEYEEDGKIYYDDWLTVKCLDTIQGTRGYINPISQSEFAGLDEKAKDNAIDNIVECIQLCEEAVNND